MTETTSVSTTTDTTWRRWAMPAAMGVAVLPFVVSFVAVLAHVGGDYHPQADQALIELQIRDIGHMPVLLGPYSRFGWFHPGPALFYLLWLPYRITGSTASSLLLAALIVNAGTVVAIGYMARRRSGLPLVLLALLLLGLFVRSLGALFFRDPWNPSITLLPFVLLVFLAWSVAALDRWALPAAAAVASFLVQTHVGYALVVSVVLGMCIILAAATEWHRRATRSAAETLRAWVFPVAVTVGIVGIMWTPALLQQLTREPGNLSTLFRFFRDHGRQHSYGNSWHVLASQLSVWPEWVRGASRVNIFTGEVDLSGPTPIALALVALIAATAYAGVRARHAMRVDLLALAAIAAGFVAVSRIVGAIFPYLVRWTWAIGLLAWLAIAWTVVTAYRSRPSPRTGRDRAVARAALALAAVGLVVLSTVNSVSAARAGNLDPGASKRVPELSRRVRAVLPRGNGVVEIAGIGGAGSSWVGAGIADDLEKHGITTRAAPNLFFYGPDRVLTDEKVRLVVLPVDRPELAAARALPGFEQVGPRGEFTLFVKYPRRAGR